MATIDLGKISFTQKGDYASGTSYAEKDVVQHTDQNETSSFVKIGSTATGQAPQTDGTLNSSHWAYFAKGTSLATPNQGSYVAGTTYSKGSVVSFDDGGVVSTYLYINNTPAAGQTPSSAGTVNTSHWQLLAKGTDAAGISWQSVVTASTLTGVAGRAYPINTTSNACAITLPAGSAGARILFTDYAGTWHTYNVSITANGSEKIKGVASQSWTCSQKNGSIELVYIDATQGWVPVATNNTTEIKQPTFDWLLIAGGGGASYDNGGGGGAGGMRYGEIPVPGSATTFTVVIGGGGTAGNSGQSQTTGGDSTLNGTGVSVTSSGGGKSSSGGTSNFGGDGGSGGGSSQSGGAGGNAIAITQQSYETSTKQGNNGGSASIGAGGGAGGGGAGGVGKAISSSSGQASVGHGGEALQNSITGSSTYYAGGGGGGANQSSESYFGLGGNTSTTSQKGGGANGAGGSGTGGNGTANTGGGGGGGGQAGDGGGGGSGVAIFKLKSTDYGSSTGSPTVDTSSVSGFTILTFNGGGTFTTA